MKYHWSDAVSIGGMFMPNFRVAIAAQDGVADNILLRTWGGLGDQICAEPTLRYALKHFKNARFTLASEAPLLFEHLTFESVYHLPFEVPTHDDYLTLDTIPPPVEGSVHWQFFTHSLTHCVDFSSIAALRCQLPIADREITLRPKVTGERGAELLSWVPERPIYVHAGKHWPSKTFPKDWWDAVLSILIRNGRTPVLIGKDSSQADLEMDPDAKNRGTVDVETKGCIDLRNKLSVTESIWLLQDGDAVLLTNDSSPLHMAASGNAWIGFVATCKHPDYITHWRKGQWGWRMKNFGRGGIWEHMDICPNHLSQTGLTYDQAEESLLRSWLPEPDEMASWAVERTESGRIYGVH